MTTLESRGYVATEDDIRHIAGDVLDALSSASGRRLDYLKSLVGTTIHELGAESRSRASNHSRKLDDETRDQHLAVMEAVHLRFYRVVEKVTLANLGGKKGDKELNKRTTYARSSASMLRSWIRVGNDITSLVPSKVTKASLDVPTGKKRALSPSRLTTRAERQGKDLLTTIKKLTAADPEAARSEIDDLLEKLTAYARTLKQHVRKAA